MKTKNMRIFRIGLAALMVMIMTSAYALAENGSSSRQDTGDLEYSRPYRFRALNLTDAQREQLDSSREAFFTATQPLRQDLYAERLELEAELAKKTPNVKRAAAIQKKISDLEAVLEQKYLEHALFIRKISPELGRNCGGYGGDRRYGRQMWPCGLGHHGMGPGRGFHHR